MGDFQLDGGGKDNLTEIAKLALLRNESRSFNEEMGLIASSLVASYFHLGF